MSELNPDLSILVTLMGHFERDAVDLSSPHFKIYLGTKLIAGLRTSIIKSY